MFSIQNQFHQKQNELEHLKKVHDTIVDISNISRQLEESLEQDLDRQSSANEIIFL